MYHCIHRMVYIFYCHISEQLYTNFRIFISIHKVSYLSIIFHLPWNHIDNIKAYYIWSWINNIDNGLDRININNHLISDFNNIGYHRYCNFNNFYKIGNSDCIAYKGCLIYNMDLHRFCITGSGRVHKLCKLNDKESNWKMGLNHGDHHQCILYISWHLWNIIRKIRNNFDIGKYSY